MQRHLSNNDDAGTAGLLASAILSRRTSDAAEIVMQEPRMFVEWLYDDLRSCLGTGGRVSEISGCNLERTAVYVVFEYPGNPREAAILLDISKRIALIRSMLSLNVKELAAALHVERPTVYAWMAGEAQPKTRNYRRIETVWTLAREWERLSSLPLGALRSAPDKDGKTIMELLMTATIDTERVRHLMQAAAEKITAERTKPHRLGLRERARQKGFTLATPPDAQQQIDLQTGKRTRPE